MRILHMVEPKSGCTYFRSKLPAEFLRFGGHISNIVAPDLKSIAEGWIENYKFLDSFDVVYFSRFIDWQKMIRYCNSRNILTVYGTDDFYVLGDKNPYHKIVKMMKAGKFCRRLAKLADGMIVSTTALQEAYGLLNDCVECVPNMLDYNQEQWNKEVKREKVKVKSNPPSADSDRIVIGYYGSATHYYDLLEVKEAIEELMKEFGNLEFWYGVISEYGREYNPKTKLIRRFYAPDNPAMKMYRSISENMPSDRVEFLEYQPIDEYGEMYSHFDIAIAPLAQTMMNIYKSNLKILEAGAYHLPIVCSNIRTFAETITHGEDGFIVKDKKNWVKYLKMLIEDIKLRRRIGGNLGKMVRNKFDINKHWDRWEEAFYNIHEANPHRKFDDIKRDKDELKWVVKE